MSSECARSDHRRALLARIRDGRRPRSADPTREHALALLGEARKEVVHADQKAAILLAAIGVVVSVFLSALLEQKWTPTALAQPWQGLWWGGGAAFGAAMLLFAMVVFPRLGTKRADQGAGVSSFIDVVRCADRHELYWSLERSCAADLDAVTHQLRAVSRIAYRKYLLLRVGLVLLASAAACSTAAALGPALA
ncbi:hypothetical protein F4561_006114 [Lipingzhangella halophila]|uniref:Pycsar effector protein domain-containing protein n=1 Tax=Lipingzhangella halophila TaxID=1783352 RepID=A0A7W7W6V4_9ACTN|nr:Pycsar system effector family protein [Lipingzhangella halophila]MBB4935220.1 hypothetical protein [Lipingzhangella halophila]